MFRSISLVPRKRRGAIAVLAALLILVAFAVVALAVDTGYMLLVRTQLQCAVDSAAIAAASVLHQSPDVAIEEAQRFARFNLVAGKPCELRRDQIQIGAWQASDHNFAAVQGAGTAVRIQANIEQQPLFFGKAVGRTFFGTGAQSSGAVEAVAISRPRDIVFVIDVSGELNDDSEFAAGRLGETPTYTEYVQRLYSDLNFGPFPGSSEAIGKPLGISKVDARFTEICTALKNESTPDRYRILDTDDEPTRMDKVYSWIIECQIAQMMPGVVPNPLAEENSDYWRAYVDYVVGGDAKKSKKSKKKKKKDHAAPESDSESTILACRNSEKHALQLMKRIGYLSYLQFMLDNGTEERVGGQYVPLSIKSPDCPWHQEDTELGVVNFPPRIEPENSVRRALVSVVSKIQGMNNEGMNHDHRDRVAVVLFSRPSVESTVLIPLTDDYRAIVEECAKIQSMNDRSHASSPQTGLNVARRHLLPPDEGGAGREKSDKLVYLVLASKPDSYSCPERDIFEAELRTNDRNFFRRADRNAEDAALMEVSTMRLKKWQVVTAGISKGVENEFLRRLQRVSAGTQSTGLIHAGTDPEQYSESLKRILVDSQKRQLSLVD